MDAKTVLKRAYSMPLESPSYPPGPYRFVDREYLIISYRTTREALERVIPPPLEIVDPIVKYEFIRMPNSTGFGDYTESGQVVPIRFKDPKTGQVQEGGFVLSMFLDDDPPIAGGREIWGFPKKLAKPKIETAGDTIVGTLDFGPTRIATGTMGYKHKALDKEKVLHAMSEPSFLLKILPHVDGTPRVCQLVRYYLKEMDVKGAWTGPASLELSPHALAPVADCPILEIVSAVHIVADLTLELGEVVYDYLA